MSDKLITSEDLHAAAERASEMTGFEGSGFEEEAVGTFIDESTFHPPLDDVTLVYGILLGWLATQVKDERNDDNGNGTVCPVRDDPGGT